MPRTYLPLLPLPVLAVIVAVAACTRPHSDEAVAHLIPPPSPYVESAVAPAPAPAAAQKAASAPGDEAPSAEEVKAFERTVLK